MNIKQQTTRQSYSDVRGPGFKRGKLNPRYKDGRSKKVHFCKCGKQTSDYRNKLCSSCYIKKLIIINKTKKRVNFNPKPRYGADNNFWKGDKIGYAGIHDWLHNKFGKPVICGNKSCNNKDSSWFEYCLLKGKKHERKRENYIILCRKCHRGYDLNKLEIEYDNIEHCDSC
jgi:hypothetical protein